MSSLFYNQDPSFTSLFRLLDDFDAYRNDYKGQGSQVAGGARKPHDLKSQTWTPKFDVRETETAYELHGELPGLERDQINIEFSDEQTIVIRGRVERHYSSGTPLAASKGAIEGDSHAPHKPTVEDESQEHVADSQVATKSDNTQVNKHVPPRAKFWVQERSVGEFQRIFSFPSRIDLDGVTAGLANGILSVKVPKQVKNTGQKRRIAIN